MFEDREAFEAYLAEQERQQADLQQEHPQLATGPSNDRQPAHRRNLRFPLFLLSRIVPLIAVGCLILWKCLPVDSKPDRERTRQHVSSWISLFVSDTD